MNLFCPERDVARAVICRAFEDVARSVRTQTSSDEMQSIRDKAIQFLTAENGAWLQSRISWCDAAGTCPDKTRKAAIRLLKSQYSPQKTHKIRYQVF